MPMYENIIYSNEKRIAISACGKLKNVVVVYNEYDGKYKEELIFPCGCIERTNEYGGYAIPCEETDYFKTHLGKFKYKESK